jgi:hypothetical protein
MKQTLTSSAIWFALLVFTILATDLVAAFLGHSVDSDTGAPRQISPSVYATRFLIEAVVFSSVGIISARRIRSAPLAGLFALSLGLAYIIYVEWNSALWYYMVAHRTRVDQFFFTAPVLAPIIFTTGACLIWRALTQEPSNHAL